MFRKIDVKSTTKVVKEWDALAPTRFQQITSGLDITYRRVLVPNILALLPRKLVTSALDAGCGVGFLTNLLAKHVGEVIGIDPSEGSIKIARANYGKRANFIQQRLEDYSKQNAHSVDLVVANMVLMNALDLDSFLIGAHHVLRPGGILIFSITHPCFWPSYSGYVREPWYQYDKEIIIESPFRIAAQTNCPLFSTHVHRPLDAYVGAFRSAMFSIEVLNEPMPPADVNALYPEPWAYPRYLLGLCCR